MLQRAGHWWDQNKRLFGRICGSIGGRKADLKHESGIET